MSLDIKKKALFFRVGKKELLDTKKESRVFKVVVVFFFFRCVLVFAHVFSLSLSLFLGRRQKKDSPSFCKGAVVERDTLDALKSTHAQGNTTNNTNRGVKESDPHTKKTREEKETQKKNLFF